MKMIYKEKFKYFYIMSVDINDLLIINNLTKYTYNDCEYICVNTTSNNNPNNKFCDKLGKLQVKILNDDDCNDIIYNDNKSYYYIIDSNNSPALGHWILESFMCIKLLIDLNKKIPNIKILTRNDKKYVKNLLKFFNINNEVIYKIDNSNNITYLPLILSLHHKNKIPEEDIYFNYHLDYYINYIKNNLFDLSSFNKCIFLPRNDFDNFQGNERKIMNTNVIKHIIVKNGGIVLDTYHLNNIKIQLSIINNTDTIILDFGSSLIINCIFLENKNIYIIDNLNWYHNHSIDYPYNKYFIDIIIKKNNVRIINSTHLELIDNVTKNI